MTRAHEPLTEAVLTEGFFAPEETRRGPDLTPRQQKIVERWHGYPALRSSRARERSRAPAARGPPRKLPFPTLSLYYLTSFYLYSF